VVVVGKTVGIATGAFIAGHGVRPSLQAGMSLAQIGEFSFMIAGLGLSLHATGAFLYAVAIAVSALTALLTPTLIRFSGPVASYVDRRLPHALQTYASLYGSWLQRLREVPQQRTAWMRIRRLAALFVLDLLLMAAIAIGASLGHERLVAVAGRAGLGSAVSHAAVVAIAIAVAAPFLFGAVRMARALGTALALAAFPSANRSLDLAAAPRRALLVTLQLAILLVAGVPLAALTQPFLPSFPPAAVLLVAAGALGIAMWRSATNLQGHARAGAQVVLEALATQSKTPARAETPIQGVQQMMPGLGDLSPVRIDPQDPCVGKSLKQLNLRGTTGATVLAIRRAQGEVIMPSADEILRADDTVVLTGTAEAVAAARKLLAAPADGTLEAAVPA
jgi:CPA2 family monovalent cation:H+ antiporter-2